MRDFALERYFSRWEFTAKYHMTASDIASMSLSELLALASDEDREAFDSQWLGYTETYGHPELRQEIAHTYDTAHPEDILCFAGAEEGVYIAMRVLLDRADHAIVAVPNYQAAETVPLDICEVTGVPLDDTDNWSLDIDRVRKAIRPNTRVISVNFPNNPTGAVLDRDRFQWQRPDGGCVGFPRYTGPKETNQFCEDLVNDTGILLLPPKIYRSDLLETPRDRFRIGFGRAGIEEGLAVFRDYLLS